MLLSAKYKFSGSNDFKMAGKDVDFWYEEKPEITQNLTFLQSSEYQYENARTETTTLDAGKIGERIFVPTQDQEESQEISVCYDVIWIMDNLKNG